MLFLQYWNHLYRKMKSFFDDFLKQGYSIQKVENLKFLNTLKSNIEDQVLSKDLEKIHKYYGANEINNLRISCYRKINRINNWEDKYFSLASSYLKDLLGPDLSIQTKLNLSIQMPNDKDSVLDLHTDALSGQSVFEVVLWVPLTRSYSSNSMYIFPRKINEKILHDLKDNENLGMKNLFIKYEKYANFLHLNYGDCLIFSPTLFHGNVLNETPTTRLSINCRFKNLFSHEAKNGERRLGSFYRVLKLSPLTKIGLSYRDDLVKFL